MILSDVSVKRPVFAAVISIVLVAFGAISFTRLPLRELPSMDTPIIAISTNYTGASAEIVESRITRVIEDQIAGIEGIDHIASTSKNGQSSISIFFELDRDLDAAASDVRDAVARIGGRLPQGVDTPRIFKMDADAFAIIWYTLGSNSMNIMDLTDYAVRNIIDRLAVIDGVGQVQGGNGTIYSMRVWLDRVAMAARGLTVSDIQQAIQSQNIELPAGSIESDARDFPVRIAKNYATPEDFQQLLIREGADGHLIRLGEVAKIEVAPRERRIMFRGNGINQLGIGIVKQSTANELQVARGVKAEVAEIRKTLPEGMDIYTSYDGTIFVEKAVEEVYKTIIIATLLVILVIYAFLGSLRAALVPAVVVPVCLIGTFGVLYMLGYSINMMTLLALVLCIGLVVDDSIVVLENVQRRIETGEPPLVASYHGARQVAFAVIATTLVLVAVFSPLIFVEGFVGRLFGELGATISAAVIISSLVALSLSPMMCSKLLNVEKVKVAKKSFVPRHVEQIREKYVFLLKKVIPHPFISVVALVGAFILIGVLWRAVPKELAPKEDRGMINAMVSAPEGTSFDHMVSKMGELEKILLPYVEKGEAARIAVRVPGGWGQNRDYNTGRASIMLTDWSKRERNGLVIADEISGKIAQIPGLFGFAAMNQGMTSQWGAPVQMVITGADYEEVAGWANAIAAKARQNPGLTRVDTDYKPTKPKLDIVIDRERAAALGVSVQAIGETLETMLGSRRVTTYTHKGREYDVVLQGREEDRREPNDLKNLFVRAAKGFRGPLIPLSNLVTVKEVADVGARKRWNRLQSVTVSANLSAGYSMGEALDFLEGVVAQDLPPGPKVDYNGESKRFMEQGSALFFAFGFALLLVFLVLAAQFESFVHPFIIMLTVPVAIAGALLGLYVIGSSLNIYSQIGMVILIGIAAKNGILIVEFANQLRDQGMEFSEALIESSRTRFRPIIMTGLSTATGAIPLILTTGPGAGSRTTIGIVIFLGVLIATVLTLFIVPVFYSLLARHTGSPGRIAKMLSDYEGIQAGTPPAAPAE